MEEVLTWLKDNALWFLLAAGTVFTYVTLLKNKDALRINSIGAAAAAILHTVIGLLCVKFFAFLEGTSGGMSIYGGILFMPVFYYLTAKLSKRGMADVFDCMTVCIVFVFMCARVNCLISGCCLGKLIPGTQLRWPTRLLEIILYLGLLFVFAEKDSKKQFGGRFYPLFLMSYGVFRFIIEWFRESSHTFGVIHISHIWSVVAIAIGAIWFFSFSKKKTRKRKT